MMYVDLEIYAVPTEIKAFFRTRAENMAQIFKRNGALTVTECWGADVPDGQITSLPMTVKRKDDVTVAFSWATWPSKEVRDEGLAKAMAEMPSLQSPMPFDGSRMIFGCFEAVVEK